MENIDKEKLLKLWHTARIAGFNNRHGRLTYAAREWEKLNPGQRMQAYKTLDVLTRGYGE